MLIKKALEANLDNYPLGGTLQPVRVETVSSEIARIGAASSVDSVSARRLRRQYRNYRQSGFRSGGWSVKAW